MPSKIDDHAVIIERPAGSFGANWLILADAGGTVPPLTAFPMVAKAARDLLMARWHGAIPETLSGHDADGAPSRNPHIAFAPLASVGGPECDGRMMGLAIIPPRQTEGPEQRPAVRDAMAEIDEALMSSEGAPLRLTMGALGVWHVERRLAPHGHFLNARRYLEAATRWASVTPIVLDRFSKAAPGLSTQDIVAQSCAHAGLPEPDDVRLSSTSSISGCPPAVIGSQAWSETGWRLPRRRDGSVHPFQSRPTTHAVLEFAEPVSGPVLLGAGRFLGMGLCLPLIV